MKILVSNVGSTSLKFKLYDMPEKQVLCTGKAERVGSRDDAVFYYKNQITGFEERRICGIPTYSEGIALFTSFMTSAEFGILQSVSQIDAVGFKTVAAKDYNGVHELNDEVLEAMRAYLPIAPAHNTAYLEAIGCFREMLPDTRFIGCFETGFHQTIPEERRVYSLPYEWYEKYGVKKLGYHGASHSYVASVLEKLYGGTGKAVSCHLGGSGSLCAIQDGRSVDTSFGMSLQVGLPQSNRTGDMDPYIIKYMEAQGLSDDEIWSAMTKESGLLGISGVSPHMNYIEEAMIAGNPRAKLAFQIYAESLIRLIGAYAAEMGGLDNIAFTGGIGENQARLRSEVGGRLGFLGVVIDQELNSKASNEIRVISTPESKVRVLVIPADEEIVIAEKTYEYINTGDNYAHSLS